MSEQPPQTLDDLLFRAEEFARFSMRARGKVPPALLAVDPSRPLFYIHALIRVAPRHRREDRSVDWLRGNPERILRR